MQPRKRINGFTLVEVLIALVIMSVGMLGIAGLYVHSMQAGRTSVFRHNAVTLAGDVADRIRANPRAGASYALINSGVASTCVAAGTNCSRDEMAANDIFLWNEQAVSTMPNGTVSIVYDNSVAVPTYQIIVAWTEPDPVDSSRDFTITIPVLGL